MGYAVARPEPARPRRGGTRGGVARLRLGVGGRGLGHGRGHAARVARRADTDDQARLGDHADPRPHAREHGDDRGDARPALRRPLPARARHLGAAGRRGLARRALGKAARARRASTSRSCAPRSAARWSSTTASTTTSRSRKGTGLGKPLKLMARPLRARGADLPREPGAEGGRARVRDRGRLAADLLVAREGARGLPDRPGAGGLRHRRRRAGARLRRPAGRDRRSSSRTTPSTSAAWAQRQGRNFYNDLVSRYGYEAEARRVQELFLDGRQRDAAAALPDALVDERRARRAARADPRPARRVAGERRHDAARRTRATRPPADDRRAGAVRRRLYLMRHGAVSYFDAERPAAAARRRAAERRGPPAGARGRRGARARGLRPRARERPAAHGRDGARSSRPSTRSSGGRSCARSAAAASARSPRTSSRTHSCTPSAASCRRSRASSAASRSASSGTASFPRSTGCSADDWDTALAVLHGGVNRAILSWALTGRAALPRRLRAGGRLHQRPRRRRRVDRPRGQRGAARPRPPASRG